MKQINTLPIENFLEKAKIASRTNQKTVNLDIKEAVALSECLALVMTRLVSKLDEQLSKERPEEVISVTMDGGSLR